MWAFCQWRNCENYLFKFFNIYFIVVTLISQQNWILPHKKSNGVKSGHLADHSSLSHVPISKIWLFRRSVYFLDRWPATEKWPLHDLVCHRNPLSFRATIHQQHAKPSSNSLLVLSEFRGLGSLTTIPQERLPQKMSKHDTIRWGSSN